MNMLLEAGWNTYTLILHVLEVNVIFQKENEPCEVCNSAESK
jgi:hypothetical protein